LLMLWGSRRIRREIEAVKSLHEPTNWDELLRTDREGHVVPAAENAAEKEAAALYARALAQSKGWNDALPQEFQRKLGKEALSAEEVKQLGEALSHYQEAIGLFSKAAQYEGIVNLPEASMEPDQKLLDELTSMREGARLLAAQACYSASQGRGDEAADDCIVLVRCARMFPGYNLITELVNFAVTGIVCRTIEHTQTLAPCSGERLEALQTALRQSEDDTPLARALCAERVMGNHLFQSGWIKAPRFFLWPNHAAYLEVLRDFIRVSREPYPTSLRKINAVEWPYRRLPAGPLAGYGALGYMIAPALQSALEKGAAMQAQIRVTLVSLAIRRARLDGMPLPAGLEELVPKYLSAIPTDPFTGELIRYRIDETGCSIYSAAGGADHPEKNIEVHLPR